MNGKDKRRYQRVDSTNLLNYICLNDASEPFTQGMGRTLNVSESGILLETRTRIDPKTMVSLAIGIGEEVVEITGEVVYLKESGKNLYEAGINFAAFSDPERKILNKFISAFKQK